MNTLYRNIIRNASVLLQPLPTDTTVQLRSLKPARALLCDVYGTMLISASGDVGTVQQLDHASLFCEALAAAGWSESVDGNWGQSLFDQSIQQSHAAARAQGVEHPEVDIVAVWQTTLDRLVREGGWPITAAAHVDPRRVAIEYEVRANPTWPMP